MRILYFIIVTLFVLGLPLVAQQQYTCSMHPQIKQIDKGECPICAMELIPTAKETENSTIDSIDTSNYICSMHPAIRFPKAGICPICGIDLIPPDLPQVSTLIRVLWKKDAKGKKQLVDLTREQYVRLLVYTGAHAKNSQQFMATAGLLRHYKGERFVKLVKQLFVDKKYRLIDIATYSIVENRNTEVLPILEKFLDKNDPKVCSEPLDPHIGVARCLGHFGKKKQAVSVLLGHMDKSYDVWYPIISLLDFNDPQTNRTLVEYLERKNANRTLLNYCKAFAQLQVDEESALDRIFEYAQKKDIFAKKFLERYYREETLIAYRDLFFTQKDNDQYIDQDALIKAAVYLVTDNNPKAIEWLTEKSHKHVSLFTFAVMYAPNHPQLKKMLYQLLDGDKEDFNIACVLMKYISQEDD